MIEFALLIFLIGALVQGAWYIAGACALILIGVMVLR